MGYINKRRVALSAPRRNLFVNLDAARRSQANKQRPAIIVSNDGASGAAERSEQGVITVVPLTSNVTRVYPFQVRITAEASGISVDSKAQAEQVREISIDRLGAAIGLVPHMLMQELDEALRLHLAL